MTDNKLIIYIAFYCNVTASRLNISTERTI